MKFWRPGYHTQKVTQSGGADGAGAFTWYGFHGINQPVKLWCLVVTFQIMKWLLNLKSNNRLKKWTLLRVFMIVPCLLHIRRVHLLFTFLMNKAIVCQISQHYQVKTKRNYYSQSKKINHFFHDTYHKTKRDPYLI